MHATIPQCRLSAMQNTYLLPWLAANCICGLFLQIRAFSTSAALDWVLFPAFLFSSQYHTFLCRLVQCFSWLFSSSSRQKSVLWSEELYLLIAWSHMEFFPALESYFLSCPAHGFQGREKNPHPQGPKAWIIPQLELWTRRVHSRL